MKKKTIKSYFFKNCKNTYRNPSVSTLFCFSKRATKYRKQFNNPHKTYQTDKKLLKAFRLYKFYITNLILYNQWTANKVLLKNLFLMSSYTRNRVTGGFQRNKILFVKQVYLWYQLKNIFYLNLTKSLVQYPTTGMLSSHFVHFLSKKNIAYQARSKYRSKIFNLNPIYYYLYVYSKLLHLYLHAVDLKLYFFTSNLSKQRVTVDIAFNISISNWMLTTFKYNYNSPINALDYSNSHYNDIVSKSTVINEYFNETDLQKKDALCTLITNTSETIADLFVLDQLLYKTECNLVRTCTINMRDFNKLYCYL